MLLRFDYPSTTWTLPDIVVSNTSGENLVTQHLPHHLSFPPPPLPLTRMDDKSSRPPRLDFTAPFSDAAKALLSSPLPPELVVDFKGSTSSHLRNSTSESNVHELPAGHNPSRSSDGPLVGALACRTLSDGARKSYSRRKLESEDSSYDSDYECSDSLSLTVASPADPISSSFPLAQSASIGADSLPSPSSQQHEDISRTVSDTLAAEFSEYVSCSYNPSFQRLKEAPGSGDDHDVSDSTSDSSDEGSTQPGNGHFLNDPSYSNRVEFAIKLGYTELHVQKALAKLGPQPAQNELLAELIRLASLPGGGASGSSGSIAEASSIDGSGLYEQHLRVHRPLSLTQSDDNSLRQIVIDGSNVAISHGNKEIFSCRGIQICVDYFRARGHRKITVFVPMWRKETSRIDTPISNQEILLELEKERILVFTPSRQVGGRRLVCYDDRYILKLAAETDGVVVSNDNYRDLVSESPEFRRIVDERILMYSFVNDHFMPPDDPLGRHGPKLDRFLRKPLSSANGVDPSASTSPPCPYGKKCTYGNKCKYYHPERGNVPQKTITEILRDQAQQKIMEVKARPPLTTSSLKSKTLVRDMPTSKTISLPLQPSRELVAASTIGKPPSPLKKALTRTTSIVPTVVLLPPELTEERPVQDTPQSDTKPILKSRSVENMSKAPQTAQQQQQQHGPMLRAPPATFSVPPPMPDRWMSPQHAPLGQKLSDPPSTAPTPPPPMEDPVNYNPHRKVVRQLTLNPLNPNSDHRVYTLQGLAPPYPPPPLAAQHLAVTRIASAPAPTSQLYPTSSGQHQYGALPTPHMQRLNSTSDTQLNLYGGALASSQDWGHDPFDEWRSPPPPLTTQQHSWAARTTSLPAAQHVPRHLSSSPVQQPQTFNDSTTSLASSSGSGVTQGGAFNEARYKLFFHLAAIFPEEQVRRALSMMPDETNAQKICAAILAHFPKEP